MYDTLDRLRTALSERYAVERVLGKGGMATVYLAEEHHPRRHVAIKVLDPDFADQLIRERFVREVDLVSKLIHPHIVPLFAAGEADGLLYYVMPYVEGESLRHRLARDKTLDLPVAQKIAREVASALHYAHENGVIHRDIKPANILLLANDDALVADFGIARAIGVATGGHNITRAGFPIGTPLYMSPEQANAEGTLDRRTDVYSLGCVLFEMLVGNPPATDRRLQAGVAERTSDLLPNFGSMTRVASDALELAVDTALAEEPSDRFATAAEFEEALAAVEAATRSETIPGWTTARNRLAALGVVVLVIVAAGLGVFSNWGRDSAEDFQRTMLVVLPFENLGDSNDEYFSDGITHAVTARLAGLAGLGVISHHSAMQYKGADKTTQQIGEELGVDYILQGTILRERPSDPTSRVQIIPELIRVSDDTHVWAATYDEDMTEVFAVQSDIAERVAQGLDIAVLGPERALLQAKPTDNLEAYEYYLRGHDYLWETTWETTAEDANVLQIAVDMLDRAVQLDSAFALAYAELAIAHWSFYRSFMDPTDERGARSRAAVDKALELQPDLPEAHLAAGLYYYSGPEEDHERGLEEFELVTQRQPNNALARELIGLLRAARGEWNEALENAAWAAYLDPRSADRAGFAGWLHLLARRYAEAEPYLDRATSLAPDQADPYSNKANLYLAWSGDTEKAWEVVDEMITRVSAAPAATAMVQSARALIATGDYDTIFEQLSPASYRGPFPFNYFYVKAEFYRLRGDRDRAQAYSDSLLTAVEGLRDERDDDANLSWYLAYSYAGLGRRGEAIQYAEKTASLLSQSNNSLRKAYIQPNLIWIYAMVGEHDAAIDQIEYLLSVPSTISVPYLRAAQYPRSLRDYPRFRELLARYEN